jgi:hypothetical protein
MSKILIGLTLAGGLGVVLGCQPGRLEECDGKAHAECLSLFGAGAGGAAGSPGDPVEQASITADTPLPGCAQHSTVGALEADLLAARCGSAGCHVPNGTFKPDLKSPRAWERLLDVPTGYRATRCPNDVYIASASPLESYFLSVVADAKPKCSDGAEGGPRMPFARPALPDEDIACFEAYVTAVATAGR